MAASHQEGGYDCQFVVPPQELQTECAICLHVVREPYLVSCCGYRFCRVCIENVEAEAKKTQWFFVGADCPLCKNTFTKVPDKLLERKLKEKQVYCQNKDLGCTWVGKLSELEQHLNFNPVQPDNRVMGCSFVQLECSYCNNVFERRKMENHELNCPKRPITCTHCEKYTSSPDNVKRHWDSCPSFPTPCPQDCGQKCKRIGIKDHIAQACPKTRIKCKYYDIGCWSEVLRAEMPDHMKERADFHVTLLDDECKKLKEERQKLILEHVEETHQLILENYQVQAERDNLQDENDRLQDSTPVSVLHVGNCPPAANEQKMKSLFGQHGKVHRVEWDYETGDAYIYYTDNDSVQRAIEKDNMFGFNLHQQKLHIYEVEPNINE